MFLNYCILNIFDYICAQNAQCWARIIKSDMKIQRYNRLKAASKRVQSEVSFDSAEWEQARPQVKIVLSTVSRWMTNRSALWDASKERRCSHQWNSSTRLHITLM